MRRVIAAAIIAVFVGITAGQASADPVDEARQRVADYYNQKFGCDSQRPLICPGPPI